MATKRKKMATKRKKMTTKRKKMATKRKKMATKRKKTATNNNKLATKPNASDNSARRQNMSTRIMTSTSRQASALPQRAAHTTPTQRTMSEAAPAAHATETVKCGACESVMMEEDGVTPRNPTRIAHLCCWIAIGQKNFCSEDHLLKFNEEQTSESTRVPVRRLDLDLQSQQQAEDVAPSENTFANGADAQPPEPDPALDD
eukprot:5119704-Pleurochrysis_carterae.AAC.1